MVTDRNSPLLRAASGLVLNMSEVLAGLPDALHLLSSGVLASIRPMKPTISGTAAVSLNVEETLIALMGSANGIRPPIWPLRGGLTSAVVQSI